MARSKKNKRKATSGNRNFFSYISTVIRAIVCPSENAREVYGIILMGASVLVLIALLVNSRIVELKNSSVEYTGLVGEHIAYYMFLFFGRSAFLIPPFVFYLAYHIFVHKPIKDKVAKYAGFLIGIPVISAILSLVLNDISFIRGTATGTSGGILGTFIAVGLVRYFGIILSYIVLVIVLLVSIVLLTPLSFREVWLRFISIASSALRGIGGLLLRLWQSSKAMCDRLIEDWNEWNTRRIEERERRRMERIRDRVEEPELEVPAEPLETGRKSGEREAEDAEDDSEPAEQSEEEIQIGGIDSEPVREQKPSPAPARVKPKVKRPISENREPGVDPGQYVLPPIDLLKKEVPINITDSKEEIRTRARKLEETLREYGIECEVKKVNRGPTVTQYEVQVAAGTKMSQITSRANEIAYALAASSVRIEAPIPGKSAVGVEIPNKEKVLVTMRELVEEEGFDDPDRKLLFILGRSIDGKPRYADLEKMPHLLIAGSTGSGKSICIHTILLSILYRARPDEVKLLMIDPKMVELSAYTEIPHLVHPPVTDTRKAPKALRWAVREMENRYKLFAEVKARDIRSFNAMEKPPVVTRPDGVEIEVPEKIPYIVIVVDEFADLMMVAAKECEDAVMRLAQMARAVGIHLILATQRPSVNVVTGVLKANLPYRIAFSVLSSVDSRTILSMSGAETLLGQGDMLYLAGDRPKPMRIQGAYVSAAEIKSVIKFIREQGIEEEVIDIFASRFSPEGAAAGLGPGLEEEEEDELFDDVVAVCRQAGQASTSMIQRRFKIGYNRAARILDTMEHKGLVGPAEGSRPRKMLPPSGT